MMPVVRQPSSRSYSRADVVVEGRGERSRHFGVGHRAHVRLGRKVHGLSTVEPMRRKQSVKQR
jgi:hypothetical protein